MRSFRLSLNGVRHHLVSWGRDRSPKIFFFHGWMDMAASFDFLCPALADEFHCIALDFRGFGKSEHGKNPLGYFFYEYLADIHELLQKLAPREAVRAVGHSMGGNILSLYAGTFPERISHMVNIEGFGIHDMPVSAGPGRTRDWIEKREIQPFRIYRTLAELAERLRKTNPRLPVERSLFLARHISRKLRGGYQIAADPKHKWIHPYLHRLDTVFAFWQQIQAKCLLVMAEETEMAKWLKGVDNVHVEMNRRLDHFPAGAKRVTIPGCGHMVHHEKPKELAMLIRNFMTT
jgi:pimeloyl-ACP methyl ester carboxylesterase